MVDINQLTQQITAIEQKLEVASNTQWQCDNLLRSLGPSKRNKPPEIVATIQPEIDQLRDKKQKAIALQKELETQLKGLREQVLKLDHVNKLNRQQTERDKKAAIQYNGSGKRPNQGRDITWKV